MFLTSTNLTAIPDCDTPVLAFKFRPVWCLRDAAKRGAFAVRECGAVNDKIGIERRIEFIGLVTWLKNALRVNMTRSDVYKSNRHVEMFASPSNCRSLRRFSGVTDSFVRMGPCPFGIDCIEDRLSFLVSVLLDSISCC